MVPHIVGAPFSITTVFGYIAFVVRIPKSFENIFHQVALSDFSRKIKLPFSEDLHKIFGAAPAPTATGDAKPAPSIPHPHPCARAHISD